MTFTVLKNVGAPSGNNGAKYPFRDMEVGDAFDAPANLRVRISSAAAIFASRNNVKFSIRKQADGCVRVFRVA